MWSVRLTEAQRAALTQLLSEQSRLSPALAAALEELDFARWDDLPEAELPWDRVEELAAAQGVDEADVVWDLCSGFAARARVSARRRNPAKGAAQRRR